MKLINELCALLKNASVSKRSYVYVKGSKFVIIILNRLYKEGFITGFRIERNFFVVVFLKYANYDGLLDNLIAVSKPSKKVYCTYKNIIKYKYRPNIFGLVNTSKGLLTYEEIYNFELHIGGEVLLEIVF